ncbi:MAG: thiamine pyrophosphate-dependent enzyme [Betaproteobacteria bacterium]|nr:thiamine pyrophosphate-dependent enzyme [Betaproteobacteria bacterium]MDH3438738.1 thiamine pyrophosphate-dependent enzyme [Betaproteobacteria bacterium]
MKKRSPNLERRKVVAEILKDRGGALIVPGLGSTTWDTAAAGDHPLTFYSWGGMGGAAMTGLGLALAQPKRRVLVITGDGEMLMGLGSLATIAVQETRNLTVIVIDNEHYGETGMQQTHTHHGVDLPGMARAAGFCAARTIYTSAQLRTWIPRFYRQPGPLFASIKVTTQYAPMILPMRDGAAIKHRFREALLGSKAFE